MRLEPRTEDMTGFDPQTWKDERRRKLERRKEDRRVQLARQQRNKRRHPSNVEDFDTSEDE